MIIEQRQWTEEGWKEVGPQGVGQKANLVLAFGGVSQVKNPEIYNQLLAFYPEAEIVLGSTAGDILGSHVYDNDVVVTAISFKNTKIKTAEIEIKSSEESHDAGSQLAQKIPLEGLAHVMVFLDGMIVNGSKFIDGLQEGVLKNISVTGGLMGDGMNFKEVGLGLNAPAKSGNIIIVGFYGDNLRVGYGSQGGWTPFGVERVVTKAHDNVLFEMDKKPALALFKEYLGEQAKMLPGSGLLFPLSFKIKTSLGKDANIVRSFKSVDEANQSLTFFSDIPVDAPAQLMMANLDRLIDGASEAATMSRTGLGEGDAELAVLVSCIGRRAVLKTRTEEELEEVQNIIGTQTPVAGFYSYGELCPSTAEEKQCQMHNQTMTITTFKEI